MRIAHVLRIDDKSDEKAVDCAHSGSCKPLTCRQDDKLRFIHLSLPFAGFVTIYTATNQFYIT